MKWQGHLFGPQRLSSVAALAFLNVVVPLAILRLAARRRPWSVRLLMAVPVAVAVPLSVFLAFEDRMPALRNILSLGPGAAFFGHARRDSGGGPRGGARLEFYSQAVEAAVADCRTHRIRIRRHRAGLVVGR